MAVSTAVTLNDLEDHSPVTGLFKWNPSNINFVQHFTRFQLTLCSRSLCVRSLLYESGDYRQETSLC